MRGRALGFTFEGAQLAALEGDTIASALAVNGISTISRSFKYHRPRGIHSIGGHDANLLVRVGDVPNVPADRYLVRDGLDVRAQNYLGSLRRDGLAVLSALGRFLPVGFYYKAFYRPRWAWELWEPVLRRLSGLGVIDRSATDRRAAAHDHCDVAIVGGGPAGLAAARAAAGVGAECVLIDRNPVLGGSYAWRQRPDAAQCAMLDDLVAEVTASPRIRVETATDCTGLYDGFRLSLLRADSLTALRAHAIVVAAGAIEQPALFANNDLPGVMLGSAAQRLMRLYGVRPGRRAAVLTAANDGYAVAADLLSAGVEVVAVIDEREDAAPAPADLGEVPVLRGATVLAAMRSGQRLGAITVGSSVAAPSRARRTIACDLLCVSVERIPAAHLLCHVGAGLRLDPCGATFRIVDVPAGHYAAGAVNGVADLAAAVADGAHAGMRAAAGGAIGSRHKDVPSPASAGRVRDAPAKAFVDFDEDLKVADLQHAVADGYSDIELAKRYSTLGMGPSQGRHSALHGVAIVADAAGRPVADAAPTTVRPPVVAEPMGALAGAFPPLARITPMYDAHVRDGAYMERTGNWLRAAFYGAAQNPDSAIAAEVAALRSGVGILDVSTLGGIEIMGEDAAEFLDRICTMGFTKLKPGRSRYALMLGERGTIVDDGVACRLAPDHFYVTASTTGVATTFRAMTYWAAHWKLDVSLVNATEAFCAANIAGPGARAVMESLVDDVDLSPEAFPFMAVVQGHVGGIPARILRSGFVGELAFEVHVPWHSGGALWEAALEAGKPHGMRLVGIEAQRLLRLEKAHLIIGQDTDALSHPYEVGLEWALGGKKPFFVGQRALQIWAAKVPRRRLVGFVAPPAHGVREGDVVLDGDSVVGRVTSCAVSPTLGKIVGLAYAAPECAAPGSQIVLSSDGGGRRRATVVTTPFYDPGGDRQKS